MDEGFKQYVMGKAAWAWCAPNCGHAVMIPELATRFGEILAEEIEKAFKEGWEQGSIGKCPDRSLSRYRAELAEEMKATPEPESEHE